MAQKTRVELIDDIDGGPATQTVAFALDGNEYVIDLSDKNATALRAAIAEYVAAGRKVGGRRGRARKGGSTTDAGLIRAWAVSQGMKISARGRVSAEIREAYQQAHA
ncbi:MAG: Lsr2 family protein [Propionibacteriaceae bacterium]|jgi:hypothetical protein|nr:Lsr2 family protein [Propionibacteriaceae bacterium]